MRRPRTLDEANLVATLIPGNTQAPPEGRGSPGDIGWPEIVFAAGFLMVAAGLALFWLPLALVFVGGALALLAWRLA